MSLIRIASKVYDLSKIDANVRNGSRVGGVGEHSPRNVGHAHKCLRFDVLMINGCRRSCTDKFERILKFSPITAHGKYYFYNFYCSNDTMKTVESLLCKQSACDSPAASTVVYRLQMVSDVITGQMSMLRADAAISMSINM